MKNSKVFVIVFCAISSALSIVLERFGSLSLSMNLKLTFYGLPLMVVGIMLGFKEGLITGIVTGTIIQLTSPYGVSITSIFWALSPIAWGGVSGFVFSLKGIKNETIKLLLSVVLASLFSTLLNTFAMFCDIWIMNDQYYTYATIMTNLPFRLLSMLILIIPYFIILKILNDRLRVFFDEKK